MAQEINTIKELAEMMNSRFDKVDQKFDAIDKRFLGIDQRFENMDQRFTNMDGKFKSIDQRFEDLTNLLIINFDRLYISIADELKSTSLKMDKDTAELKTQIKNSIL